MLLSSPRAEVAGADFGEGGGRQDTAPVCESAGAVSSRGRVIIHASQNLDNQSFSFSSIFRFWFALRMQNLFKVSLLKGS